MRQVQSAPPRHQELAAHRGHGIEHVHLQAPGGEPLGRHQTRRAAANHGDAFGSIQGHGAGAIKAGADRSIGLGMEAVSKGSTRGYAARAARGRIVA
ncbi:hypothetical protein G6F65_017956 [Rhizopus arrhizus]|nr:hypothetical protein G6F65_017956 [Rhizopus arrhizus]